MEFVRGFPGVSLMEIDVGYVGGRGGQRGWWRIFRGGGIDLALNVRVGVFGSLVM